MRARIFNIMQYEKNPFTGADLREIDLDGNPVLDKDGNPVDFGLNEAKIKPAVQHKSIRRFAYICHDADVFLEADEMKDARKIAGMPKPRHWHVVLEFQNAVDIDVIARWFQIPSQYIEVPRGGNRAFLDCVEYLTHERKPEKHQYSDDLIVANFDFRDALEKRKKNAGKEMNDLDSLLAAVMAGEKRPRDVGKEFPSLYVRHAAEFDRARRYYLENVASRPLSRINYYVCGDGGEGKGLASRALARSLFPQIENDEDLFFCVNGKQVAFEGYDGQPVIIWNDFRSIEFFKTFDNRGRVFDVLDTHPAGGAGGFQHVKFGRVRLLNSVNIINSVQPWKEFIDGLVGEYTDRDGVKHEAETSERMQAGRRICSIIPLRADDFDILLNKGLVNGSREFCEFYEFANIQGNFRKIALMCGQNEQLARQIEHAMLDSHISEATKLISALPAASSAEIAELMATGIGAVSAGTELQKSLSSYFGNDLNMREMFLAWVNLDKNELNFDDEQKHIFVALLYNGPEHVPDNLKKYLIDGFDFDASAVHVVNEKGQKVLNCIRLLASMLDFYVDEFNIKKLPF